MKIAVISDIHGNKLALDAVLDDIKKNNTDTILVLGDLAMGGYDPNYTIEKIFSLPNAKIIQGNTDKLIVDYNDELYLKMKHANPLMAEALKLDDKEITPENKEKLKNLPVNLSYDRFLMVHGSPRRQDENLYPDSSIEFLNEVVKDVKEEIVLCGHTHLPCGFSLEVGKTIVNVGSIGRSMTNDRMPVYLQIEINQNGECLMEHKVIKYDNKKVADIIANRGFPLSKDFSKLYLREE